MPTWQGGEVLGEGNLLLLGGKEVRVGIVAHDTNLTLWEMEVGFMGTSKVKEAFRSIPYANLINAYPDEVEETGVGKVNGWITLFLTLGLSTIFKGPESRSALIIEYKNEELQREAIAPVVMSRGKAKEISERIYIHRDRFFEKLNQAR